MEEKNNSKNIVIAVLLIIIIALIGVIGYVYISKDNEQSESKVQDVNKENEIKEEELNASEYAYLYDRLVDDAESRTGCNIEEDFLKKGSKNQLENGYFISAATGNLVSQNEYQKIDDDSMNEGKILEEKVSAKLKELFDSSISIKLDSTLGVIYNSSKKAFYLNQDGVGCSIENIYEAAPVKATKKGDTLELTMAVGYTAGGRGETYKFYASEDTSKLIKEFKEDEDSDHIDGLTLKEYVKKNAEQFAQYKLTFKIENDKYLFSKIEKIK